MRRVKLIPLAMAAVLAGAINVVDTGSKGPDSTRPDTRKVATEPVASVGEPWGFGVGRFVGWSAGLADRAAVVPTTTTTAPTTTVPPTTTTTAPPPPPPPPPTTAPPPPAADFVCPVQGGGLNFIDSFGYARSGGRAHQGIDMMAAYGTPTVAPVSGRVEHRTVTMGGQSWFLYGDNGVEYYGAHLSGYESVGAGWVAQGTVIGYVGNSGNASGGAPHLHFEMHPGGGSAVNPYPTLASNC